MVCQYGNAVSAKSSQKYSGSSRKQPEIQGFEVKGDRHFAFAGRLWQRWSACLRMTAFDCV